MSFDAREIYEHTLETVGEPIATLTFRSIEGKTRTLRMRLAAVEAAVRDQARSRPRKRPMTVGDVAAYASVLLMETIESEATGNEAWFAT